MIWLRHDKISDKEDKIIRPLISLIPSETGFQPSYMLVTSIADTPSHRSQAYSGLNGNPQLHMRGSICLDGALTFDPWAFLWLPLHYLSTYNTAPGIRDFTTSWSELISDSNQIKTHYWVQVALHLGLTQFRGWYGLKTYEGPIAQIFPLSIKCTYPLILACPRKLLDPLSRCLVPVVPLSRPRCPVVF
jgi:hypothetical protein